MTEEQKKLVDQRERKLARQRVYDAARRDEIAYRDHCRYHYDPEAARERVKAWKKANPERNRELDRASVKRRRENSPQFRLMAIRRERRRYIREILDKAALGARILANVDKVVSRALPVDIRGGVIALVVERVYSGELPIRVAAEHAKVALADYRREHERFSFDHVSLDTSVGENGFSLGHAMGVY